jgi:hypothetical protein
MYLLGLGLGVKFYPTKPNQNCGGGQKNGKVEVTPLNSQTYNCVLFKETLERFSR